MIITHNNDNKKTLTFADLKPGDVFRFIFIYDGKENENFYLKLEANNGSTDNCVNLSCNYIANISLGTNVILYANSVLNVKP